MTNPAQTIADLRHAVSSRELRRAIRQADVLGLPIGDASLNDRTRSDLERDFLDLCRRHRLPGPDVNVPVGPYLVDFLWPARRVVVETDGYLYHCGRQAFEDDHQRDVDLRRLGYDVRRFSFRQVQEEAAQIAADIREALGLAS